MTATDRRARKSSTTEIRARETNRLHLLLGRWGVHASPGGGPLRRKLAADLEATGRSGELVTDPVLRRLTDEGSRIGWENPALYVLGILEDPEGWISVLEGLDRRERIAQAYRAPKVEPPNGDLPSSGTDESDAEAFGLSVPEFRQRQRERYALSRMLYDHRSLPEIASENSVSVETIRIWLDRAIAARADVPWSSFAEYEKAQVELARAGRRRMARGEKPAWMTGSASRWEPRAAAHEPRTAGVDSEDLRPAEAGREAPGASEGGGFDVPF